MGCFHVSRLFTGAAPVPRGPDAAISAQFGEIIEAHPISRGGQGHSGLNEINHTELREAYSARRDDLRSPAWTGRHTDAAFMETLQMAPVLNAMAMPSGAGTLRGVESGTRHRLIQQVTRKGERRF